MSSCEQSVEAFRPVRAALWSSEGVLMSGETVRNPLGALFLSAENLHYIYKSYTARYEEETGWRVDDDSHRLDSFTTRMHDQYMASASRFMPQSRDLSRLEQAQLVQRWNEHTIKTLADESIKVARRKAAYLKRARDPLYGKRETRPIAIAKPNAERKEQVFRDTYAELGSSRLCTTNSYQTAAPDE